MASEIEVKAGTRFQLLTAAGAPVNDVFEYSDKEADGTWYGKVRGRLAQVRNREVINVDAVHIAYIGPPLGRVLAQRSDIAMHMGREVWVSNNGMDWQLETLSGVRENSGTGFVWLVRRNDHYPEFKYCCVEEPLDKANEINSQFEQQVRIDLSYREACRRTMLNSIFIGKRADCPSYLQPGQQFDLQFAIFEFVKEADARIAEDKDDTIRRQFLRQVNVHLQNEGFPVWHDTGSWECVYDAMRSLITGVTKRVRQ